MSIEQWYECATNLDKYQRESKREEEKLRREKENGTQRQRRREIGITKEVSEYLYPRYD